MVDYNLIVPFQDLKFKDISIPYYFSDKIRFIQTPEFLKNYVEKSIFFNCTDKVNLKLSNICIEILKVDSCESKPYVITPNKYELVINQIFNFFFTVWIKTQNIFRYSKFYIYQDFKDEDPKIIALYQNTIMYNLRNLENTPIDIVNFKEIYEVMTIIENLDEKSLLHFPINSTITALTQPLLNLRFIMLWIALESLFEKNEKNLAIRLIKRISNFLTNNPNGPEYAKLKKSYTTRSDLVHGSKILKKNDQCLKDFEDLENWVRCSFIRIFSDNQFISNYSSKKGRKRFLNSLNEKKSFIINLKEAITKYFSDIKQ